MSVILLGYMGCGKSTIGNLLAQQLNYTFIDLDVYIEKQFDKTIKEIFDKHGEIYFRKIENKCLQDIITTLNNFVLALGGGTPCYGNNMDLIVASKHNSVYLKTSINILYKRLISEKANRPLICNLNDLELKEFIAKHLFERSYFYNQAKHKIETDNLNVQQIVNQMKILA